MPQSHFGPELFAFLRDLKKNNSREWFQANKKRYEGDVKEPLQHFIADFSSRLGDISRHFLADPRRSMFRIHRDVRFSRDKSPYKTHAAAQFRHLRGGDVHAPGFYLHLEPDRVFFGAGLWKPDSASLRAIRQALAERPDDWRRAVSDPVFTATCHLEGESLKRPPKGFDPEHPLIEDLRRKDFIAASERREADALRPDFLDRFTEFCRTAAPLAEFLTRALDLEF